MMSIIIHDDGRRRRRVKIVTSRIQLYASASSSTFLSGICSGHSSSGVFNVSSASLSSTLVAMTS